MFCIHFIMNIPPTGRLSILSKLQKFFARINPTLSISSHSRVYNKPLRRRLGSPHHKISVWKNTKTKLVNIGELVLVSVSDQRITFGQFGCQKWQRRHTWQCPIPQSTYSSTQVCNGIRMSRTSTGSEQPLVSPPVRAMTGRGGGWGCPKRPARTPNLTLFVKYIFLSFWWKSMCVEIQSFNCG